MTYRDFIRQCPELGEMFADWEVRISCIENSLPVSSVERQVIPIQPQGTDEVWETLRQHWAKILHNEKQVKNLVIAKRKDESPQDLSKLYTSEAATVATSLQHKATGQPKQP